MVGWNALRVLPRFLASSASPFGPKTMRATTPMTSASGAPTPNRDAWTNPLRPFALRPHLDSSHCSISLPTSAKPRCPFPSQSPFSCDAKTGEYLLSCLLLPALDSGDALNVISRHMAPGVQCKETHATWLLVVGCEGTVSDAYFKDGDADRSDSEAMALE